MFDGQNEIHAALRRLGKLMLYEYAEPIVLVVCGGSALNVLGIAQRTTKDVDVLAIVDDAGGTLVIRKDQLFPPSFVDLVAHIGADIGLLPEWLNMGPKDVVATYGFPPGMTRRLTRFEYGPSLTVYFIGRLDQVHLKVLAAADPKAQQQHMEDLKERIRPTSAEVHAAIDWLLDRSTSAWFRERLRYVATELNYDDIAAHIPD